MGDFESLLSHKPTGFYRVVRGGSWGDGAVDCRPTYRQYRFSGVSYSLVGFRIARDNGAPNPWPTGSGHVVRGGSWANDAWLCRSAIRSGGELGYSHNHLGFRLARDDGPSEPKTTGSSRVIRGGSWSIDAVYCRSAFRSWNVPGLRISSLGFRIARDGVPPNPKPTGSFRVIRGGSWYDEAKYCRSALRDRYGTGRRREFLGFRLARTDPKQSNP